MKADGGTLITLAGYFALMSLFAIGGGNSAVPEMQRFAVDVQHWMSDRQFADAFALAQLSPGPNLLIVTLIGYHVAGLLGALVTTLAMCGPTCVFAFFVGHAADRFRNTLWHAVLSRGMVPVTLGLTAASAAVVARAADYSFIAAGVTLAAAVVSYAIRLNPLWIFAGAAALGLFGAI